MDLEQVDRLILGVKFGGTIDQPTFMQIANLARRFLLEEQKVLDLGKQIEGAIGSLRTLAEDIVNETGVSKAARKMVERYQTRMEAIITQREDFMGVARRQQKLVDSLLETMTALYKMIRELTDNPTQEQINGLRDFISVNAI